MRIAYVCADPGVPVFGRKGCSVHVQEVIRAMRRHGATVKLFANRFDGQPPRGLESVTTLTLPRPAKGDPAERERASLAANAALADVLRREGPFDVVYERYSLWSEAGMRHAWSAGSCGLLEVNAPLIEEQMQRRSLINDSLARQTAERIFAAASGLVAVSREVAEYLHCCGVDRERILITPNGVDGDRFAKPDQPARQRREDLFTVGFIGTLKPWHGLDHLLDAMERLCSLNSTYRLLIVGDGPLRPSLQAELDSRGGLLATNTELVGSAAHDEIPAWLASMDAVVAPYPDLPDFYFSPLKLFEYMAAGRPIVASRIGQVAEMIDDGVTGLLVPPGDAASLAVALHRLRSDRRLCEQLGLAAQREIADAHSWDAVVERCLSWGMNRQSQQRASQLGCIT